MGRDRPAAHPAPARRARRPARGADGEAGARRSTTRAARPPRDRLRRHPLLQLRAAPAGRRGQRALAGRARGRDRRRRLDRRQPRRRPPARRRATPRPRHRRRRTPARPPPQRRRRRRPRRADRVPRRRRRARARLRRRLPSPALDGSLRRLRVPRPAEHRRPAPTSSRRAPTTSAMLRRFNFILSSAMFRKAAWAAVGGMDEDAGYEDWDFWLRLGEHGHHGVHAPERRAPPPRARHRRLRGRRPPGPADQGADRAPPPGAVRRAAARLGRRHPRRARTVVDPGLGVIPQFDRLNIVFAMTGWADEGGGTILPRQIAKALVRRGHHVTVISAPVQAAARRARLPRGGRASTRASSSSRSTTGPSLFNDPQNPEREIEDPAMRRAARARSSRQLKPDVAHVHSLLGFSLALGEELDRAGVASVFTSHNYWPLCPRMYLFRDDLSLCDGPSDDGAKCGTCVGRPGKAPLFARRHEAGKALLGKHVDRHLAVSSRVRELYVAQRPCRRTAMHVLLQQPETVDWIWERAGSPTASSRQRLDTARCRSASSAACSRRRACTSSPRRCSRSRPASSSATSSAAAPTQYVDVLRGLDTNGLLRLHGGYEPAQLAELLAGVDVVCVPSVWEDCAPLVVAEALAARAPVVGSRIGGIPDFVADGETGFLVAPAQRRRAGRRVAPLPRRSGAARPHAGRDPGSRAASTPTSTTSRATTAARSSTAASASTASTAPAASPRSPSPTSSSPSRALLRRLRRARSRPTTTRRSSCTSRPATPTRSPARSTRPA